MSARRVFTWNCKVCAVACSSHVWQRHAQGFCESCNRKQWIEREKATSLVLRAVLRGDLTKASAHLCVDCGKQARDWDHRDYTKPLDVVPVCRSCNIKRPRAFSSIYRPEVR